MHRHVEVDGNEFPFSRGASFYELNSEGQIVYGRDLVEPALKPGSSALLVCLGVPTLRLGRSLCTLTPLFCIIMSSASTCLLLHHNALIALINLHFMPEQTV